MRLSTINCQLSRGFSLMEILIAIAIVIILSGISWATIIRYQPSLALSATTRDLTSDLRLAQQLSVTEQINHGIFFDTLFNEYQLKKFEGETIILFTKQLPTGITFCDIAGLSEDTAIFNPYGSVAYSGAVCLLNSNGQNKTIEIKPSGFVKIQN